MFVYALLSWPLTFDLCPQQNLATVRGEDVDGRIRPGEQILITEKHTQFSSQILTPKPFLIRDVIFIVIMHTADMKYCVFTKDVMCYYNTGSGYPNWRSLGKARDCGFVCAGLKCGSFLNKRRVKIHNKNVKREKEWAKMTNNNDVTSKC